MKMVTLQGTLNSKATGTKCVKSEKNKLSWYLKNSKARIRQIKVLSSNKANEKGEFKQDK